MHILIVEDELPTAEDIMQMVKKILNKDITFIHIENTVDNALAYLREKPIDVLLLDLNLNARDGFQILKEVATKSFHTIVISGNLDRAVEAFEYGVLDFIAKPHTEERLKIAFNRIGSNHAADGHALKYLSVKKGDEIQIIPVENVRFFKAANIYVELHLSNGHIEVYDKLLKRLTALLPNRYCRIHKSYIVDTEQIEKIQIQGGGLYHVILKSGDCLPVSRQMISVLKERLNL
jgi:DNA-binding LytR/AlgR family response regulator